MLSHSKVKINNAGWHTVCPEKKWDQNVFFVISPTKLWQFWWNWYTVLYINTPKSHVKNFHDHLTWIMSLHYLVKLEMPIEDVLPLSFYRQKLQNLTHLICGLQIHQIWIHLITTCVKYSKKVYKRCITDLEPSMIPKHWQMSAAITTWSSLVHSVLSRRFSFFQSVTHALYTFSCNSPHMLPSTRFKSGKFEGYR